MDKEIEDELNWFAEDPVPDEITRSSPPVIKSRLLARVKARHKSDGKSSKSKNRADANVDDVSESKKLKQDNGDAKISKQDELVSINLPVELMSKPAKSAAEKLNLLEERDRLMRITFTVEQEKSTTGKPLTKGVCPDMCPEKERILRDVRGIVASHEAFPDSNVMDHSRAVKEYARSSADQEHPLPHELRPTAVLRMTMDYLITEIMCKIDDNEYENKGNWYDFCWGRLRAIRKDIIQQQLCDINTVAIVEQCARFHICCFDRLWGSPKSVFDDKINSETLMNCLTSLMYMYDDLRKQGKSCPNEAEFRAYLVFLKLHSGFVLSEFQQFPLELQKSHRVREAVEIHTAYSNNMYSTYFMLLKKTTYLNACLMQRFFGHLRTRALEIIVKSHCPPNKKSVRISVAYIAQTLKFDNNDDCINFCVDFGLSLNSDEVNFDVSRNDFYFPETMYTGGDSSSLVTNKREPVAECVLGHRNMPKVKHVIHSSFTEDGFLKSGALDASDQEEKLLRDDVERSFRSREPPVGHEEPPLPLSLKIPEPQTPTIFDEEPIIIEPDEIDMSPAMPYVDEEEEDSESEKFQDEPDLPGDESVASESPNSTDSDQLDSDSISAPPEPVPQTTSISPVKIPPSPFLFMPKPVVETPKTPAIKSPTIFSFPVDDPSKRFKKMSEPFEALMTKKSPQPEQKSKKPKFDSVKPTQKSRADFENEVLMDKLKKKLGEKMKRVTARKYALIWRSKVEKIRKQRESETPHSLRHISLEDYAKLWGSARIKYTGLTLDRLNKRKKANVLVSALLHLNIIDQLDSRVKMVGERTADILGRVSVKWADRFGNIAQPQPVFWKLLMTLPARSEDGAVFPAKLRHWVKTAFHSRVDPAVSDLCCWKTKAGVPVFIHPVLTEGLEELRKQGQNFSAAVLIRADGWESAGDTAERLKALTDMSNGAVSLAVLSLGTKTTQIEIKRTERDRFKFVQFADWSDTNTLVSSLFNLAQNHHMEDLKVQPLGFLVEVTIEKFLDALHQDQYLNEELCEILTEPNPIIRLYNRLIEKLEEEISQCCFYNYYGLACELEPLVRSIQQTHSIFPANYDSESFRSTLRAHMKTLKLAEFKWAFTDSVGLMAEFKEYCDSNKCSQLLSKIIRLINPPDADSSEDLFKYLKDIPWLPILELFAKSRVESSAFQLRVVFRDDKVKELTLNRWWLTT